MIANHARRRQRRLITTDCSARVPGTSEFLKRIGAHRGLHLPVHQLRLADIDRDLIASWIGQAEHLSDEFTMGFWDDAYPEERIHQLAKLLQVVANDQPRDKMDMEDMTFTADSVRQFDAQQRAGGQQRWTLYLVDRPTDQLAGMTEVTWSPSRSAILLQGFTGVSPQHRRRGLGRWLKAAMLQRILDEHPGIQIVRANNATSNAPMLRINRALGFQQEVDWSVWQVELASVEHYLASKP